MCNEIRKDENIIDTKYSKLSSYISKDNSLLEEEFKINIFNDGSIVFQTIHFDSDIVIFENSKINISIKNHTSTEIQINISKLSFIDCKFSANTFFKNNLDSLEIHRCIFEEHFRINDGYDIENQKIKISDTTIKDSVFEKDFTAYKAEIHMIEIRNVDFESLSEFNEVTFQEKFDLQEITYKGFTLFDNCTFNTKAEFEYIIFEKFSSFRNSTFIKGLNLDFTSADKEINFFGIKGLEINESKENTSQETYRIIKYNFEKIGNKIEANKYLTLELDKHRKTIWNSSDFSFQLLLDGVVSFLHWISSNHSSNWLIALIWIFIVSFLTNIYLDNMLNIEHIFRYVNILSKIEDFHHSYYMMVLNKASLGYLYYQFLTAVRKDTRK